MAPSGGLLLMNGKNVGITDNILKPGEYARHPFDMRWHGCSPNGHGCNLTNHKVIEHEDGTITVSPSILISDNAGPLWHGFLERGVWREG